MEGASLTTAECAQGRLPHFPCPLCSSSIQDKGDVQYLSDELSEVNRSRQLTVQFLRADFAAVSEVSGKNLC